MQDYSPYLEFVASLGASVAVTAFCYGKMKERMDRLTDDMKQVREDQKELVSFEYFEAVIEPMRKVLDNVQQDIKEVLRAVSKNRNADR